MIETADAGVAEARAEEAEAVCELHRLNAQYIRAFVEADVAWYDEHLSADFTCSLADGRLAGSTCVTIVMVARCLPPICWQVLGFRGAWKRRIGKSTRGSSPAWEASIMTCWTCDATPPKRTG